MRIIISGKNIPITDALRAMVAKKLGKFDRYFDEDTEVRVVMSVEKNRHIVEVTIPLNGTILRAEDYSDDMYTSIEGVLEKLERQIRKHKTKLEKRIKEGAFKYEEPIFDIEAEPEELEGYEVVRTKRFALKPMSIEEAITQMELLGHDFFVFNNAETEEVNVVYRRRNGGYGLIEPEYA
ncbi:ribosome-associated translation inhibitor RaiA [Mahella sp.]|uniref:ribosome hibernation-promoting factor, HPF/YfiA family n=1 Tax=Mahella sp. TaxID=2798721 RepID=UPI0025C12028|nr:ribosome-associated translation inhibitor RaiA [Mahella sp.]MBZ4665457.1 ribosomal protein [Mahella sp.]